MSENKSADSGTPGASPATDLPGVSTSASTSASASETRPGSTGPSSETSEAAARASTDAPASAPTVTPADPPRTQQQLDAAQARAAAVEATAKQEAAVHERDKGSRHGSPASPTSAAPAAQQAQKATAGAAAAASDASAKPAPGSPPPGFTSQPDFTAFNPPPASALPPSAPRYLRQSDSAWSVFGRIIAARARQLFDRAGQRITQRTLRIGVSARIFHPEPGAKGLRGKTLQYLEESIAHWVMSRDVIVFMIPTVGHQGMLHPSNIRLRDYAKHLDGLLLQGGADVSPQSYEEVATRPEWPGDRVRDMY
jgi:putative glutamine amidotransferase